MYKRELQKAKRRQTIFLLLATMLLCSVLAAGAAFGDSLTDAKTELNSIQSQIKSLQSQINSGKSEAKALQKKLNTLDQSIANAEVAIEKLQSSIDDTKEKVAEAQRSLEAKEEEVETQNDTMGLRIRNMYKNGETSILEILLGSDSITDLMTNIDMAALIVNNDKELLAELELQYITLQEYRIQLETLQESLEKQQADKQEQQQSLESSRTEVASLKSSVESNTKLLEAQEDALNEEANALTAEILKLQSSGDYIGGSMIWPVPASTRITSPFGNRIHPILKVKKLHTGIDIGVGTGNEVLAVNAGTVIKAAWNNSYGYMVMIDHGGGIVTLYAHNSKLLVKTGDVVTQGQQVAKSGSTGASTGPHVHFEVRLNGVYQDPLSNEYVGLYASYND